MSESYFSQYQALRKENNPVVITGARQSGKTSFVIELMKEDRDAVLVVKDPYCKKLIADRGVESSRIMTAFDLTKRNPMIDLQQFTKVVVDNASMIRGEAYEDFCHRSLSEMRELVLVG